MLSFQCDRRVKAGGLLPDLYLSDIQPIVNAYVIALGDIDNQLVDLIDGHCNVSQVLCRRTSGCDQRGNSGRAWPSAAAHDPHPPTFIGSGPFYILLYPLSPTFPENFLWDILLNIPADPTP